MADETWILCNASQKDFPPKIDSDGGKRERYWGLKDIFICEKFLPIEDFKSGQPYSEAGCDHFGFDFSCMIPVLSTWSHRRDCKTCGKRPEEVAFKCLGMAMMQKGPYVRKENQNKTFPINNNIKCNHGKLLSL